MRYRLALVPPDATNGSNVNFASRLTSSRPGEFIFPDVLPAAYTCEDDST